MSNSIKTCSSSLFSFNLFSHQTSLDDKGVEISDVQPEEKSLIFHSGQQSNNNNYHRHVPYYNKLSQHYQFPYSQVRTAAGAATETGIAAAHQAGYSGSSNYKPIINSTDLSHGIHATNIGCKRDSARLTDRSSATTTIPGVTDYGPGPDVKRVRHCADDPEQITRSSGIRSATGHRPGAGYPVAGFLVYPENQVAAANAAALLPRPVGQSALPTVAGASLGFAAQLAAAQPFPECHQMQTSANLSCHIRHQQPPQQLMAELQPKGNIQFQCSAPVGALLASVLGKRECINPLFKINVWVSGNSKIMSEEAQRICESEKSNVLKDIMLRFVAGDFPYKLNEDQVRKVLCGRGDFTDCVRFWNCWMRSCDSLYHIGPPLSYVKEGDLEAVSRMPLQNLYQKLKVDHGFQEVYWPITTAAIKHELSKTGLDSQQLFRIVEEGSVANSDDKLTETAHQSVMKILKRIRFFSCKFGQHLLFIAKCFCPCEWMSDKQAPADGRNPLDCCVIWKARWLHLSIALFMAVVSTSNSYQWIPLAKEFLKDFDTWKAVFDDLDKNSIKNVDEFLAEHNHGEVFDLHISKIVDCSENVKLKTTN